MNYEKQMTEMACITGKEPSECSSNVLSLMMVLLHFKACYTEHAKI